MADVFISYSKQAKHLTQELDAWLKDQKFDDQKLSVWWDDELRGGDCYPTEIRRQLLGAKAVIVLWSRPAVKSDWVYAEAVEAARCGNIIPVIADDVSPAMLPLPFNAGDHVVRLSDRKSLRHSIDKRISGSSRRNRRETADRLPAAPVRSASPFAVCSTTSAA